MNWEKSKYFQKKEFDCQHTGENEMQEEFIMRLNDLRHEFGKPMIITSGYRHATHPIEARKKSPGAHNSGCAADIALNGQDAYQLLSLAFSMAFTGIGVNMKGNTRFIHLDTLTGSSGVFRPIVWSY